jgi:hypothetical protein
MARTNKKLHIILGEDQSQPTGKKRREEQEEDKWLCKESKGAMTGNKRIIRLSMNTITTTVIPQIKTS